MSDEAAVAEAEAERLWSRADGHADDARLLNELYAKQVMPAHVAEAFGHCARLAYEDRTSARRLFQEASILRRRAALRALSE